MPPPDQPAADTAAHAQIPLWTGMAGQVDAYDGFLLDLWGTVHDGLRPLPGVLDCLARLKEAGKRILILSNAPRRNDAVIARMRRIGIPDALYDAVLSSGEATWEALRDRADNWHRALGRRCYLIGHGSDDSAITGLDLTRVADVAEAEFVVCVGTAHAAETVADYEELLAAAKARDLPMICANPDLEVLRGEVRELCAGALAARYEEIGGDVAYHGKPHAPIYDRSLAVLGIDAPRRILAVGDSLRTDIAGALAVGIDSLFITGGIYAAGLGIEAGEAPDPDRLAALCAQMGVRPTAAAPAFRW